MILYVGQEVVRAHVIHRHCEPQVQYDGVRPVYLTANAPGPPWRHQMMMLLLSVREQSCFICLPPPPVLLTAKDDELDPLW